MSYTVSQVAKFAGVSVRLLHHYDSIGLLSPQYRSQANYRLYSRQDVEKLQQIMLLKKTGMGLGEISAVLAETRFDRQRALVSHKALLIGKRDAISRLIELVDKNLEAIEEGRKMELKELFDGFDPAEYEQEAKQKYGAKFEECKRKTARYTKEDWQRMKDESKAIMLDIVANMNKGAVHPDVTSLIALHRDHITRWFYDCTPQIYSGLSDLYVQDARFTATYEKIKPGLASFMSEAMKAYLKKIGFAG